MAADGIYICALKNELNSRLNEMRLTKIQEPEPNEILLTFKGYSGEERLVLSVNASQPLCYLSDVKKESPMEAPLFLMVLRKHLSNARFIGVSQPSLERILFLDFEHMNEMGDLCLRRLAMEFMGKYSNLILTDEHDTVIDSIIHVSPLMSSLRTVLPGKEYFIPNTQDKKNPLTETREGFLSGLTEGETLSGCLSARYTGISSFAASEWLLKSGLHPEDTVNEINKEAFSDAFFAMMKAIKENAFSPVIVFKDRMPKAFNVLPVVSYSEREGYRLQPFSSVSELTKTYFSEKNREDAMRTRSQDLRKLLKTVTEREAKKADLYRKQLKDTEKRDTFKLYGELLTAYQYSLPEGEPVVTAENYYDGNKPLKIPVDPAKSIPDNAKAYFDKYGKLKRTNEALTALLSESEEKLKHLESVALSIAFSENDRDLSEIRRELSLQGYLKREAPKKNAKTQASKPYHYRSSDGFDIYVGRNNTQNDELTFKFASGEDYFFHAKKCPGSHVILKTRGEEIPDRTFEEAASLAAFYSAKRADEKVEIDYLERKNVKKPNNAKPGFVVYYTNYSMMAKTDIASIGKIS